MRDGHKRSLIYQDFPPEAWGGLFLPFVFTVQRLVLVFNLKNSFVNILNNYRRTMKINNNDALMINIKSICMIVSGFFAFRALISLEIIKKMCFLT